MEDEIKKSFTLNSIIVFVLTTTSSVINYVCQILMGRFLSIENYGIINTIFSLILIIGVVGNAWSMILSKDISKNGNKLNDQVLKLIDYTEIILLIICLMLVYPLFVMLGNNWIIVILTVFCLTTSIYPLIYQGILGGLNKFTYLGLYTLVVPLLKSICVGILFVLKINNLYLIILSIILGNFLSLIIGKFIVRKNVNIEKEKEEIKEILNQNKNVLYVNLLMMFLMNVDILFLSIFAKSKTIGLYSSVLTFGKMIYYFVTALVTVMLPLVAKKNDNKEYAKKFLYNTLLYTVILTIIFLIPSNIFTKEILNFIFGNKYEIAVPYMKYASLISLSYSLNLILLNYNIGINKIGFMKKTFFIGSIILIIFLVLVNNNINLCLILIAVVNFVIFFANLLNIKGSRVVDEKRGKIINNSSVL